MTEPIQGDGAKRARNSDESPIHSIQSYLKHTHSAVSKLFEARYSYDELLLFPERPGFTAWGDDEERIEKEYQKWAEDNKAQIEERLQRDEQFADEVFAIRTLCGAILQFAFMAIKQFSENTSVPDSFQEVIKPNTIPAKFCIGRLIDDIPLGLVVYAGRNQSHHYDDGWYREPTKTVFSRLANWYSPTFRKYFFDDRFDLNNQNIINFADWILWKLDWNTAADYEEDMRSLFHCSS